MEIEIFTWTGRIIWWSVCACTIVACVVAPLFVFIGAKRRLNHWRITRNLVGSGLTPKDVSWVYFGTIHHCFSEPRPEVEELMNWLQTVLERIEARKKLNKG